MKPASIDLAQEEQEESATLSVTPGEKESDEAVESEYPHFHFESAKPLNIPKTGCMEVEYEIVYENDESALGYLYKVDIFRILGFEGGAGPRGEPRDAIKTEDALDKLAAERMKENENV